MKTSKLLFVGVIAALALAHAASAQTSIYLSGAPATRKIWNLGLLDTLAAQSGGKGNIQEYFTGSSFNSANQIVLTGGTIGGNAVTIYGSWTGSTGGNQSVAINPAQSQASLKVPFINLSAVSGTGSVASSSTNGNLIFPQINLSDTWQVTTPFNGAVTITSPHTNYDALTEATPNLPAVTGYKFVANAGSPSSISNITTNLARQFFTYQGGTPLAFFSGNNADENTIVYPVGRDISSGARYILLAETGIGTANSNNLYQYEPTYSGTGYSNLTNIASHPAASGTINLISFPTGAGGYPSFSTVEAVLSSTSAASVGYVVSYVTDTDATTVEGFGAHELSWNGVYYGTAYEGANNTAPVSIAEGAYTYWSYLHVYYDANNATALQIAVANALSQDLSTDTGTGAILTSDLNVSRTKDGGLVVQNY